MVDAAALFLTVVESTGEPVGRESIARRLAKVAFAHGDVERAFRLLLASLEARAKQPPEVPGLLEFMLARGWVL